MKTILQLFILQFLSLYSFSQDYIFKARRLEVEKDALANYISSMSMDQSGFLWLGTRNGLHRFDGYNFENFQGRVKTQKFDKKQVNCNFYRNGMLFSGTQRGVSVINTATYQPVKFNDSINKGTAVKSVYAGYPGWVHWISEGGIVNAKQENGNLSHSVFLSGGDYNPHISGEGDELFCLMDFEFYVLKTSDLSIKFRFRLLDESVNNNFVKVDADKVLFIKGTSLYQYDRSGNILTVVNTFKRNLNSLQISPYGYFSIEEGNSIQFYDSPAAGATGEGIKIDMQFDAPIYFSGLMYLKDQLLVSSSNGLFIIDINPRYFNTLLRTYDSIGNYFYDPRGIAEFGEDVFLFSFPKVHIWNKKTNLVKRLYTGQRIGAHAVLKENDTVWIGTDGAGLVKFSPKTAAWTSILPGFGQGNPKMGIPALTKWGDNRFLLGSYAGVYIYERGRNDLKLLKLDLPGWNSYQPFVEDIIGMNDGGFLLATNRGAFRIGKDLMVKAILSSNDGNTLSEQAHALLPESNGNVWVGTSNGLFLFDPDGNLLSHYTASSGLAGNRIASLVKDRPGNLWVGTFSGLSCILKGSGKILNFHEDEGLPENEFNHASSYLLSSGELVMGTTKGFVRFDPQQCLQNPKIAARVSISKIEYGTEEGEKLVFVPDILDNNDILLGKGINYAKLFFRYSGATYLSNVNFDYLIEGVHDEWQSVRKDNFIQLVNLRPGRYKLKVRMIIDGSFVPDSVRVFNLNVSEFFYKTIWFYLLMVGIVFLLVVFYLRALLLRERKIRELRLLVSRNLHDEVGSYLTGISMNLDMIRKKTSGINEYQESISDLSRKALAALKDGLWSLDRETDNGQHLWDRVKVIAKETFEPLGAYFSINSPKDLSRIPLSIIQKNQLIYVIKECFTNAMKYGKGNSVSISWREEEGMHRIVIRNRKSEAMAESGTMHGLDNIRYRMSELGGMAAFEDNPQEFSVSLHLDFIR